MYGKRRAPFGYGGRNVRRRKAPEYSSEVYSVCVIAISKNGAIALQKRTCGTYGFIGGKVERGEEPFDGIVRESREEVGDVFADLVKCNAQLYRDMDIEFSHGVKRVVIYLCTGVDECELVNMESLKYPDQSFEWLAYDWYCMLMGSVKKTRVLQYMEDKLHEMIKYM